MSPCPRCSRPNAPHRETCIYCGERMPSPTAPPPPRRERALPADFDALVRKAMTGKGIGALKKALEEAQVEEEPPPLEDPPAAPPSEPEPEPLAEASPASLAAALRAAADRVVEAVAQRDQPGLEAALEAAARTVARLRVIPLEAPPEPPSPTLPPQGGGSDLRLPTGRHRYALALATTGTDPAVIAQALGIDLSTARAAVAAGGSRVVLRSASRDDLEARAARVRDAGVRARVLEHEDLRAFGPALALVAVGAALQLRTVAAPLWELPVDPANLPRGELAEPLAPWLLVPGEVEERRLAGEATTSRWQRAHYAAPTGVGTETRVAVLDVHTPAGILRVREGACDWRDMPGCEPASQRRSMRAFIEAIQARWPEARIEPRRVCGADPRPGDTRADGWASWEEHSRVCGVLWA